MPEEENAIGAGHGTGYDDEECSLHTGGAGLHTSDGDMSFLGSWVTAWDCWADYDKPAYLVLAYRNPADADAAIAGLPANQQNREVNGYCLMISDSFSMASAAERLSTMASRPFPSVNRS